MVLKEDMKDWEEIETVFLIIGKRLGLYEKSLELSDFPKHILWSASEDSIEIEAINNVLRELIKIGAIEERDGERDYEFRWNPNYSYKWGKRNTT